MFGILYSLRTKYFNIKNKTTNIEDTYLQTTNLKNILQVCAKSIVSILSPYVSPRLCKLPKYSLLSCPSLSPQGMHMGQIEIKLKQRVEN